MTSDPAPEAPRPATPLSRLREPWLTPARMVSLIAVVLGSYGALVAVRALRTVLVMLLLSLFLSFAMEPAVQWLGQRGWRRGAATLAVFVVAFVALLAAIASIVPLLVQQVAGLIESVPRSLAEVEDLIARLPLPIAPELRSTDQLANQIAGAGSQLRDIALGAAGNVLGLGLSAFGVIFQLFTVALVTYYLVADGPRLRRVLARRLPADRQREMLAIWELAVTKTGGYVYSRVLLAAVCATLHAAFFALIGVPYPIPLGVWVGITSAFIPVVGTYLGGILALVVALANQPFDAALVALFLVLYQQFENYLIAPRVQARTMDIHPAVAFVAVVVGGTLLGAIGALLALPATAIIQALLSTYVRRNELIDELARYPIEVEQPQRTPRRPAREKEVDA